MATIGIFDSGLGGLSVLRAIAEILPNEKFLYFADSAYCPYGEKTPEYIIDRSEHISSTLIEMGADIIVIACNTATAAAISYLRQKYSDKTDPQVRDRVSKLSNGRRDHIMFIGMEPAVKPAALGTKSGIIGVLATAGTLKASKYLKTKGNFEDNCEILEHVGKGFVELVENDMTQGFEAERIISESLSPLIEKGADTIVLGCTHYPFLVKSMQKIAGPSIRFIDPAPAVARHLAEVLKEENIPFEDSKKIGSPKRPDVKLMSSGNLELLKQFFNKIYPSIENIC